MKKLRVGIIYGGRSGEHEVSVASAASIFKHLDRDAYEPVADPHREGRPLDAARSAARRRSRPPRSSSRRARARAPAAGRDTCCAVPSRTRDHVERRPPSRATVSRRASSPAWPRRGVSGAARPVRRRRHGAGPARARQRCRTSAPGVLASAAGMDKAVMKVLFAARGLPVCDWHDFVRADWERDRAGVIEGDRAAGAAGVREAGQPRIERRHLEGQDRAELWCRRSSWRSQFDRKVVVEAAVPNAREIECAVLGNDEPKTSVPGEIIPSREFYDYEAKYLDEDSQDGDSGRPRRATQVAEVQRLAIEAFRAIDCGRHGARRLPAGARQRRRSSSTRSTPSPASRPSACTRRCGRPSGVALPGARRSADPARAGAPRRKAAAADQRVVNRSATALAPSLPGAVVPGAGVPPGRCTAPQHGHHRRSGVARAYDLILDADFDELTKTLPATCPPAPVVACRGLEALSLWWQIQLDPDNRSARRALPGRGRRPRSPKPSAWTAAEPRARRSVVLSRRRLRRARAVPGAAAASGLPPPATASGSRKRSSGRWRSTRDARRRVRHRHVSLLRRRRAGDLQVPALPAAAAGRRSRRRARQLERAASSACWCAAKRISDPRALSLVRAASRSEALAIDRADCRRAIRTTRCSGRSRPRSSTSTSTITPPA